VWVYAWIRMLICMRTTINLPDALAEAAKARAAAEGRTFTSLVEQGLRAVLADSPDERTEPLPAFGSPDGRVLVDLDDHDAVWDVLDEVDDRSEAR
jgi:plasmid stability protein